MSISASVDRDESGGTQQTANNAVCAGSTKRTHFHRRRIVGPDSLTRRDIRRREQRATRQKPASRPSAYILFSWTIEAGSCLPPIERSRVRENGTALRVHVNRSPNQETKLIPFRSSGNVLLLLHSASNRVDQDHTRKFESIQNIKKFGGMEHSRYSNRQQSFHN